MGRIYLCVLSYQLTLGPRGNDSRSLLFIERVYFLLLQQMDKLGVFSDRVARHACVLFVIITTHSYQRTGEWFYSNIIVENVIIPLDKERFVLKCNGHNAEHTSLDIVFR